MAIYAPMIVSLIASKDGSGLSRTTWALQLLGFSAALVYPSRKGFPLSSFADMIALTLQAFVILVLSAYYEGAITLPGAVAAAALPIVLFLVTTRAPLGVCTAVQAAASATMTVALVPQVVKNFAARSSGGWSRTSALLSTGGNAVRVFTTLQLTKDPILLGQFVAGTVLNGLLLAQTFLF